MALILHIETSGALCSVALGKDGTLLSIRETDAPNSHAAFSPVFIDEMLKETGIVPGQLNAIAISEGPGSYTGLRIGSALAKGMCYTLNIPLIPISTLQVMARNAAMEIGDAKAYYAPLIDARRMEVYTAVYNYSNETLISTAPVIVGPEFHRDMLKDNTIYYFGSGADKSKRIIEHKNAIFINKFGNSAKNMLDLAFILYNKKEFADLSSFEPKYLKLFHDLI